MSEEESGGRSLPRCRKSSIQRSIPTANPRAKVIIDSLIKHLFEFATEVDLTIDEWLMACNVVSAARASS